MHKYNQDNQGEIQHSETKCWFTYRSTANPWALLNGLKYEIDVLDGIRFANILKTVAHVAIDEGEDNTAIIEKWKLSKHNQFQGVQHE